MVFSENTDLLDDIVNGLLKQENILQVSVFNDLGELIIEKHIPPIESERNPNHLKKIPGKEFLAAKGVFFY